MSTSSVSPPTSRSSSPSSDLGASSETYTVVQSEHIAAGTVIPAVLNSRATFERLGFDRTTAESLWQRFPDDQSTSTQEQEDLFDYARRHIEDPELEDPTSGCDDWDACMIAMGINERLRTAILEPEFEDIRYTATCKFWVLDAMDGTWLTLKAFHEELGRGEARIQS